METGENGINEALKVFFQSSPDVMVIIDPEGTILDANPPFIEMFACYHSQVIGENFFHLIHSQPLLRQLLSKRKEIAQKAVRNGQVITFEDVQVNTINRITIYPVLISDGKANNLLIVKQDITPQRETEETYRTSQNQPVFTPENYHLGVWSIDLKTNESFCSPRNAHIFGYDTPPAVWNLKTILEHVIPEDRSKLLQFYQEGVKNLTGWNIEYRICRFSDNKTRWLLDIGRREHDEKGKIVHLSGITSDITELKEAEQKIADLEQHLDVTSQSCRLGLWKVQLSTMDLTTNAEFDRIHGFSLNNITLTDEIIRNYVVPEDYDRLIALIDNCVTNHVDGELEYRIRRQDGLIRWLSLIAKIQYNLAGEANNIIGVIRDITAQKEKEKKAEDLQIQWDVTANQCNIGMWRVDLETGQVIRGVEHARLFGDNPYNMDWSVNKFLDHVVPEDREMAAELYNESLVNNKDVNFDCRIRRKDGKLRWINVIGSFQFDEHNKATCVVGTTTDITEKKILEIEREELQQQLQQSQKMELIGQLAGGIAHDFNNLLAAIQGNTEHILSEISSTNPHFQNLNSILNSVSRSTEMVRQLLAFARKQSVTLKNIELDAELDDMYLMLRKLIKANITLLWKLNCPETFANIDPSNLVQIITNLCVNSRDAIGDAGGTIILDTSIINAETCDELQHISYGTSGKFVRIAVSDTGSGIDPLALPHIFEPFFTTKGIGKGTGLGLSMVYGLVKQNNGHIACRNEVDKGTKFEIFFPIVPKSIEAIDVPTEKIQAEITYKATILVVEDEPDISKIIRMILEKDGFNVLIANNAEDALGIAATHMHDINLVISDIVLPGMNGVQMSKELLKKNPKMQFLFMSGYSTETLSQYGKFNVDTDFISKPFNLNGFDNQVHAILTRQQEKLHKMY